MAELKAEYLGFIAGYSLAMHHKDLKMVQRVHKRPQEIQQSHSVSQLNRTDSKRPTYVLKELNEAIGGVQNDIVRRINKTIQNKHRRSG